MIFNWLGNVLFARRQKKAIVLNLTPGLLSEMETFVRVYNEKHRETEWITMDDIAEVGIQRFCSKYIRLNFEEEELPPARPVPQAIMGDEVQGRRQLRVHTY